MKKFAILPALTVLLTLGAGPSLALPTEAPATPTTSEKAQAKQTRVLKRLTHRFDQTLWQYGEKVRVKGDGGAGIFIYVQIRKCGKGRWTNDLRETTTSRGIFDFDGAGYDASTNRKYKVKDYHPELPNSVQFGFFIPGNDQYKSLRVADSRCLS